MYSFSLVTELGICDFLSFPYITASTVLFVTVGTIKGMEMLPQHSWRVSEGMFRA